MALLNTNHYIKLHDGPTRLYEAKIQRTLRKMKHKFTNQEYQKLYPDGSNVGRFHCTGKVHKVPENGTINDLPNETNSIKYLNGFNPSSQSEFTIKSTKHFISKVKQMEVHQSYQMISFDVKLIFTNVPLSDTIDILLPTYLY